MSVSSVGEIAWVLGIVAWYVIRYPFERRAKRVRVVTDRRSASEIVGLAAALFGLAILPGFYVATGIPESADYPARWWAVVLGAIIFASALWVFRRSHKELGRNWSITLEIRDRHALVSGGPYAVVRHPMYTSFMLMGLGQAFLLSNWVAGLAGLIGFAVLFFLRVDKEERMMLENFGPQYRAYMERTKRIIPYLY
jgi:protein-S-isoprenylcysteine O-methyltransferase Ste14